MTTMIIQFIVIFLNLVLGIFILSQDFKSSSNITFSLMSFVASIWSFANYMSDSSVSLIWMKSSYALGVIVIAIGYLWTISITKNQLKIKRHLLVIVTTLIISVGSFFPNFIYKSINRNAAGDIPFGEFGWGLLLYTVFYFILGFLIIFKLYRARKESADVKNKKIFRNVYYGALITLLVTFVSSFMLPFFSIFPFGGIDNAGFLIFLLFIAYSITRHHLFNIKVIAIELVTFGLWITILIRILTAGTLQEALIEGVLLVITVAFGIMLIRSTLHEIRQRERIEKLSNELQKAYASLNMVSGDQQKTTDPS